METITIYRAKSVGKRKVNIITTTAKLVERSIAGTDLTWTEWEIDCGDAWVDWPPTLTTESMDTMHIGLTSEEAVGSLLEWRQYHRESSEDDLADAVADIQVLERWLKKNRTTGGGV